MCVCVLRHRFEWWQALSGSAEDNRLESPVSEHVIQIHIYIYTVSEHVIQIHIYIYTVMPDLSLKGVRRPEMG